MRDQCLHPVANAFLIVTAPAVCSVSRVTASDDKLGAFKSAGAGHSGPTNVQCVSETLSSVSLMWDAVEEAEVYRVERQTRHAQ